MRRGLFFAIVLAVLATAPAGASHDGSDHTANLMPSGRLGGIGPVADIAFWGTIGVASAMEPEGIRVFDIADPDNPRLLGSLECGSSHFDVGIWGTLAFLSTQGKSSEQCGSADETGNFSGIRIVSIADPARPHQVAAVPTCTTGSHTHTVLPELARGRLVIYSSADCIDIVEVPLADPASARRVAFDGAGCHDITVFTARSLAAAACENRLQMWDITDPLAPRVLGEVTQPLAGYHHSALFSSDGRTVALGDETSLPTCAQTDSPLPTGGLFFYDVGDPAKPRHVGSHQAQHRSTQGTCWVHQYNLVPRRDGRQVLTAGWYGAGVVVVDFTNPAAPVEIGHYRPSSHPTYWSAYLYRDRIYASDFGSAGGIDVYRVEDPAFSGALSLPYLNAQTQEPYPPPPPPPPPPALPSVSVAVSKPAVRRTPAKRKRCVRKRGSAKARRAHARKCRKAAARRARRRR